MLRKILISMAALLAVVGCAKQADVVSADFAAGLEFDVSIDATRVAVTEDGEAYKLSWTKDDLISVFYNDGGNSQYKFDGETGDVSGKIVAVDAKPGSELPNFYAIYPYNESNDLDGNVLSFTLPAEQSYEANTFGLGANTMVARTIGEGKSNFAFENVCGYICLKVYGGVTVKSIELKGNNNEVIAGAATYNMESNELAITGNGKAITLSCNSGVATGATKADATAFWFVVPPTTFTNGFTATITDAEGTTMTKKGSKSFTVAKNTVYNSTFEFRDDNILFDARFNADGSAENVGSMPGLTIEAKRGTTVTTAKRGDSYVAVFGNVATLKDNEVHADGFYYVDYSTNSTFKEHLADGFTMEVLCRSYAYRGNFWSTPFSTTTNRVFHSEIAWGNGQWSFAACTSENDWNNKGIFGGWWWWQDRVKANTTDHVVLTFDGNDAYSLFVNGTERGPFYNSTTFKPGNAMAIGALAYTGGNAVHNYCGEIAIARVYDSKMSKAEVVARYNALKPTINVLNAAAAPTSTAKKVSIIGDSYSTFSMYSNVDLSGQFNGYSCMYPYAHITDVKVVTDTWWGKLCSTDEFQLEVNNSYGGSTICNLSYNNTDVSNTDLSFIHRVGTNKNGVDTMGNPDIILIFGGTNDSWANARMGKFVFADWTYYELMSFRGGFAKLITKLKERYPNAEIYNICNVSKYDGRPGITKRAAESMAYICKHYNVPNIQLDLTKGYPDMRPDKPGEDHPVEAGMQHIFEQVYAVLTGAAEPTPAPTEKPMDSHPALDGEPIDYTVINKMYLEYKNGNATSINDYTWVVTDYIAIPDNATHISVNPISGFDGGAGGNQTTPIAFYDANKNYLKEKTVPPIGTCSTEILNCPIPEEAAYVRFCWADAPYPDKVTGELVEPYGELNAVWHLN